MSRHEVVFNTNIYSTDYIQINCCGWLATVSGGGLTNRPFGRADYQILYIMKGSMLMEDTEYKEGSVILFKPYERQFYFATAAETTYYWIHFSGHLADEFFGNSNPGLIKTNHQTSIVKFVRNTVSTSLSPNPPTDRYVEADLLLLLNKIAGERAQSNTAFRAINPAIVYMNENFTESVSNEDYARMCGMSKFHFIRKFSELVDMPPQKYRIKLLLDKSLELLSETDDKISVISHSLGFDDNMYFSKLFKKHFNMTPSAYRLAVKSDSHIRDNAIFGHITSTTGESTFSDTDKDKKIHLSTNEISILNYIESNHTASTKKMSEDLDLNIRTVQRIISTLKTKGLIKNSGNRKNNKWKLIMNNL